MASIEIKPLFTKDGKKTCKNKESRCILLGSMQFGQKHFCFFTQEELQVSDSPSFGKGLGSIIPSLNCPLKD
jgi:hypothetical protein